MRLTPRTAHKTLPCILLHVLPLLGPEADEHVGSQALKNDGPTKWQDPESLHHQLQEKRRPLRHISVAQKQTLTLFDPLYIWGIFVIAASMGLNGRHQYSSYERRKLRDRRLPLCISSSGHTTKCHSLCGL